MVHEVVAAFRRNAEGFAEHVLAHARLVYHVLVGLGAASDGGGLGFGLAGFSALSFPPFQWFTVNRYL